MFFQLIIICYLWQWMVYSIKYPPSQPKQNKSKKKKDKPIRSALSIEDLLLLLIMLLPVVSPEQLLEVIEAVRKMAAATL